MGSSFKNRVVKVGKFVIPLGIGFYLLWYFYHEMNTETKAIFYQTIRGANYFWIVLAMVLGFFSHLVRAARWKYTLEPMGYSTSLWHRYHAIMIGYLMNLLIPRAGEMTRAGMLYRSDKVPFSKSFGTIITERIIDVLLLGLILLAAIFVSIEDILSIKEVIVTNNGNSSSDNFNWILLLVLSVAIGGIILFFIFWKFFTSFRIKIQRFARELFNGTLSVFKTEHPGKFIFQSFLIWGLYLLIFGIQFQAFEATKDFPIQGILIGFIVGSLGVSFTNGGIGAYPYLVGLVVTFYIGDSLSSSENAEGVGKALGMMIWASQTVVEIVLGLISLIFMPRNFKKEAK